MILSFLPLTNNNEQRFLSVAIAATDWLTECLYYDIWQTADEITMRVNNINDSLYNKKLQFAIHIYIIESVWIFASLLNYSHSDVLGVDAVVCHGCGVWGYSSVMLQIVVEVASTATPV